MRTRAFVEACKRERDSMLALYAGPAMTSAVAKLLHEAALNEAQRAKVIAALDVALTDCFYTMLLGLDGSASLGGVQQPYRLLDKDGALVSESEEGDLESLAYEVFQEDNTG